MRAMHSTVSMALDGSLSDISHSQSLTRERDHVRKINELNHSWSISTTPIPAKSNEPMVFETLSDFDSMAINIGIDEADLQFDRDSFVHLEHFVIDLKNEVAWKKKCSKNALFKLMKTVKNDRTRSRLTNRKTFDLAAAFQAAKSDFFAK